MRLPILNTVSKNREIMGAFGGYHHDLVISDNEFYDEEVKNKTFFVKTARNLRNSIDK